MGGCSSNPSWRPTSPGMTIFGWMSPSLTTYSLPPAQENDGQ
jgi:hypothetical protein